MRGTILFLGLFAMCQSLYLKDDQVQQLLDLLKKASIPGMETKTAHKLTRTYDPKMARMPADPKHYDLDELFQFPGSDFLVKLIWANFTDRASLFAGSMEDFRDHWPILHRAYTAYLEPRWNSTMAMFVGNYAGIPEFFTQQVTWWVANFRFVCPSAFFDKIFSFWSIKQLDRAFYSEDESMYEFFYKQLETLFPGYSDDELSPFAEKAVFAVHDSVVMEMMQHLFGYGFKDLGMFMHRLYWHIESFCRELHEMPLTPERMSYRPFGDMVNTALMESDVRCETGMEVMQRYARVVSVFKDRFEEYTITFLTHHVEPYLWDVVKPEDRDHMTISPEVVQAISGRIRQYITTILSDFEEFESSLMPSSSPDFAPLQMFVESIVGPGKIHLIYEIFQRLGFTASGPQEGSGMHPNIGSQEGSGMHSNMGSQEGSGMHHMGSQEGSAMHPNMGTQEGSGMHHMGSQEGSGMHPNMGTQEGSGIPRQIPYK